MPVAAIVTGAVLLILAWRGTEHEFFAQLEDDYGQSEFWAWFAAVMIIGGAGLYAPLRKASNLGLALVITVLVIKNRGVFAQLANLIEHPPAPAPVVPMPQFTLFGSGGSSGTASSGNGMPDPASLLSGGNPLDSIDTSTLLDIGASFL